MVDIHSHILYGVDDGPEGIDESIELLKQAISVGYTDIVCSSHYYIGRFENVNYHKNFSLLQERIKKDNLSIEIYKGNEFALLTTDFSKYNEKVNRINGGKYLLVELKDNLIYPICKNFFKSLLSQGIVPIFAHIERYPHLKVRELIELQDMGVILQVNLRTAVSSLERVDYLLKNRYIGVIATDTHRLGRRDYDIQELLDKLKIKVGKEYFNILTEINPRNIINSEDIERGRVDSDEVKKINRVVSFFSSLWSKLCRK